MSHPKGDFAVLIISSLLVAHRYVVSSERMGFSQQSVSYVCYITLGAYCNCLRVFQKCLRAFEIAWGHILLYCPGGILIRMQSFDQIVDQADA